jgi:hypothetical protein
MTTTFKLPICHKCFTRIRLTKVVVLLPFVLLFAVGILFPQGSILRDGLMGLGIAGLIAVLLFIIHNLFDPAMWFQDRFMFKNREYLKLFCETNPAFSASRHVFW